MKTNVIPSIGILLVLLFLSYLALVSSKNTRKKYEANIEAMSDTVKVWKNKNGQNVAKIKSLEFDNTRAFTKLDIKDQQLLELQKEVKKAKSKLKKQGSVNIFTTNTEIDTIFETTVRQNGVYVSKIQLDDWITGTIITDSLKSDLNLSIINKYLVVVGSEKKGFFKKRVPFAMVTNYNPYTTTESLRTYQVKVPRPKRLVIGPYVGYNGKFNIGVGLTYGLIRL